MTLKEVLKANKASTKKKIDNGFWEVRLDVEVVEQVHIVEYVKASSESEAQTAALKQFEKRPRAFVHDRASRNWKDNNRHSLQHLRITEAKRRKKFTPSKLQREILKALAKGMYLKQSARWWYLVNPTVKDKWGYLEKTNVPSVSVDSLFQKGLLTDFVTSSMSDQEVEVQAALGSLPELKAYTVDKETVETLGLRL